MPIGTNNLFRMSELILWDKMKSAIIECHSVDEVATIRNQAEAYRYALKQAKESPEVIRKAEEIKLRAERRAGELLKEIPKAKGAAEKGWNKTVSQATTALSNMGISRDQSSKWQKIASIPEDKFENFLSVQKELSTAGVLKVAKTEQRENEIQKQKDNIKNDNYAIHGLYDVISVDPPWNYGRKYDPESSRVANPYPEMTQDELRYILIP